MFCMSEAGKAAGACGLGAGGAATPARRGRTPSADVERELLAAAEAGIAPMGVYNRLGGKDGLVDTLLIKGFDRLRAAIEAGLDAGPEADMSARLYGCGLSYREFALANPHFYAIMFEDAIPHEFDNPEVKDHARATFGALVRMVELSAAAGVIAAPDPIEAAQQIWSAVHGAVALELKGLVLTENPAATYRTFLHTLIRGLAPGSRHHIALRS